MRNRFHPNHEFVRRHETPTRKAEDGRYFGTSFILLPALKEHLLGPRIIKHRPTHSFVARAVQDELLCSFGLIGWSQISFLRIYRISVQLGPYLGGLSLENQLSHVMLSKFLKQFFVKHNQRQPSSSPRLRWCKFYDVQQSTYLFITFSFPLEAPQDLPSDNPHWRLAWMFPRVLQKLEKFKHILGNFLEFGVLYG